LDFFVQSVKTCRRYTKFSLELPHEMDASFVDFFSGYGNPEIIDFSSFSPESADFFKIRAHSFDFELSGPLNGFQLKATFKKEDHELVEMVWAEIGEWLKAVND
jgi:hypothetical protein